MAQPILGSREWMLQSMRTVRPVFDGNNIVHPIYLTAEDGTYIVDQIPIFDDELREDGSLELREDGSDELRDVVEGFTTTYIIVGTTVIPANLVRWI